MINSLEDQLLYSSLLCSLKPDGNPAYRLQLFFVANKELKSKSHQSDFQRCIETSVNKNKYWINFDEKGSGDYLFTKLGYDIALKKYGDIKPIYPPVKGNDYHVILKGEIGNLLIEIETIGNKKNSSQVFINKKPIASAKEACDIIRTRTKSYCQLLVILQ